MQIRLLFYSDRSHLNTLVFPLPAEWSFLFLTLLCFSVTLLYLRKRNFAIKMEWKVFFREWTDQAISLWNIKKPHRIRATLLSCTALFLMKT